MTNYGTRVTNFKAFLKLTERLMTSSSATLETSRNLELIIIASERTARQ